MICPRCKSEVPAKRSYCDSCGADLTVYKKIVYLSNRYYNKGLEHAQIRDLSGAAEYLRKSLEMNKCNVQARNLLGLVYFEMGEVVAAFGEWVISRHFCPENNLADYYLDRIQGNPTKFDGMNQAIKKYNLALESAKQGGDDLAILQLKKVVSIYPNFVRARLLLALLYLHTKDKERAKKQLIKVLEIDTANVTALRYMAELTESKQNEQQEDEKSTLVEGSKIAPVTRYSEERPNIMAWVALLVGALIGVMVTFLLIVPTAKKNIRAEYDKNQLDYSSELRIKEATITSLEKEVDLWQDKYEEVAHQLEGIVIPEDKTPVYDEFFAMLSEYTRLQATEEQDVDELSKLAKRIYEFPESILDNKDAQALYQNMKRMVGMQLAKPSYDLGRAAYQEENYEQAIPYLQNAYDYGYEDDHCYYYLAKCYQMTKNYEQAAYYYKELIKEYPGSELTKHARSRLKDMGYSED